MVIIQKRVGQLGNQLFAIAHFTAAAIENDYRVLCPCFEHRLGEFPNININRNLKGHSSWAQDESPGSRFFQVFAPSGS